MKNSIFMDGITNIVLVDGVVRFDLVAMSNDALPAKKDTPPKVEVVASMATTIPGFLRLNEQMQVVIRKMVDQGLLKRADGGGADAASVAADAKQLKQ
jgi:hypothetical protein